jgi:hypothetical protein
MKFMIRFLLIIVKLEEMEKIRNIIEGLGGD